MSSNIENYKELAESAFEVKNYEEAVTYYNKILEIEPADYYVRYKKGLAVAMQVTPFKVSPQAFISPALKYIEQNGNALEIRKEVAIAAKNYYEAALNCLEMHMKPLKDGGLGYGAGAQNAYQKSEEYKPIHQECSYELMKSGYNLVLQMDYSDTNQNFDYKVAYIEMIQSIAKCYGKYMWLQERYKDVNPMIQHFAKILQEIEPEGYQESAKQTGGCYVATAVYGSYDCPEVWTLRRFRDDVLAETWYGIMFIKLYYAISPTLVKWFGDKKLFRNVNKPWLDNMVERLNEKGFENTPYQDKQY